MANVSIIVNNDLCNSCCECISACSSNSICIMINKVLGRPVPFVTDPSKCEGCDSCLKACPQAELAAQATTAT